MKRLPFWEIADPKADAEIAAISHALLAEDCSAACVRAVAAEHDFEPWFIEDWASDLRERHLIYESALLPKGQRMRELKDLSTSETTQIKGIFHDQGHGAATVRKVGRLFKITEASASALSEAIYETDNPGPTAPQAAAAANNAEPAGGRHDILAAKQKADLDSAAGMIDANSARPLAGVSSQRLETLAAEFWPS